MGGAYEEYLAFLESLGQTLEQLTELAREKADAVRRGDLVELDGCMKREQALSLTLRSMDKKRENMLGKLGLSGVPLSGLAGRYPQELRSRAKTVADGVDERYRVYASAASAAQTALECSLHQIEKVLLKQEDGGAFTDIRV